MPKVSVVIPVYNVERYLGECLDSVLGQTLKEIEVICVDDGSTDGSGAILDACAARDPRVRVIRQANAGAGAARNRALDEARGEAVVFMDPDDRYPDADVLRKMYEALASSGCELAGGDMRRFPEENARAAKLNAQYCRSGFPHAGLVSLEEYQSPFRYTCYIYRRNFLNGSGIRFPPWRRFQDPPFLARALIAARQVWAMDEVVYCYRVSETGVDWNANGCARLRAFLQGFDETLDIAEAAGCRAMYVQVARSLFRGGRFKRLPPKDPFWREVRLRVGRMKASGLMTLSDWAALLRAHRFGGGLRRRFSRRSRIVGLWTALRLELMPTTNV